MSGAETPKALECEFAGRWGRWATIVYGAFRPVIVLSVLSTIYFLLTVPMLHEFVNDPARSWRFIREDAQQYRDIGQSFADGDFSMGYVKKRPHRQPLFPLLLAPALKLGGGDMFVLGMVNVLIGWLTLLGLYLCVLRLFGNVVVAAVVAGNFITNSFLMRQIGTQLLTEPLFILIEIPILYFFIEYVRERRACWLWSASAVAGISYLARTNGLFLWMALIATLFCWDLWRLLRPLDAAFIQKLRRLAGVYALAVLIGVACTSPSWVPRMHYYGNPIFHGHLANFMWVDSYEEAHSTGEQPAYTWHDYADTHSLGDSLHRWWTGFCSVCYLIPAGFSRSLQWMAMMGVIVAIATRNRRILLLAVFCFVQLQPIIWTNLANPSRRVAYPTIVCFQWIFAALALTWIAEIARRWARDSKAF